MLAQADFQRALALALGEFASAWTIVGDCAPVDRFDASHWGSGPQSFQVTLRHRVTGHLKVLGRRVAYEPGATVHPAVALSLVGAYRHGNSEPIRVYLEEIGVAAVSTNDTTHFFRRASTTSPPPAARAEPAEILAAGLAVAAPLSSRGTTSVVGEPDGLEREIESRPQRTGLRSWRLKPKWPSLLTGGSREPREVPPPPVPAGLRRSMRMPQAPEARKPMLGRLRRELQIWYWRRAAGNGQDKSHARD
ncbi:MAG: hypothetical protein DME01_22105 [Candidatus Rokuibacteriota bacterium]|nr:MAG: hypothetical protein DME01_22105 [Candidatus Rokubacteria bacterium]